ncbi:MAG: PQQ-dependent sugar dehydrogenase, partial [Thiohalobacterales bacterium]|nr:PQQ-dependent sugar dehydrogenase [Thiohalobacterales bacterium]
MKQTSNDSSFFSSLVWPCVLAALLAVIAPLGAAGEVEKTESGPVRIEIVAQGLEHPWGLAFLPDGRMLVTERPGRLRIVEPDGSVSPPLSGLPEITARGQGGLLDVALHPGFEDNGLVYLSYTAQGRSGVGTEVARGRLEGNALVATEVIFRAMPKGRGGRHFGSRLVF